MLPTETAKNRIMILGPKDDGTYVVEFRTAEGDALAISIPRNETAVIQAFPGAHAVLRAVRPEMSADSNGGPGL